MTDGLHSGEPDEARQAIAATFDRTAETYDAVGVEFFGTFAEQLLDDVGSISGQAVLDVGCGRGAVLFPAAERVGATGSVLGIDLSAGMIARTAQDIEDRGLTNATAMVMDGQEPVLPGRSFDTILSSCVVFFLPDPIAGLRAWHDLLAPGGRIGLTTFGKKDPRWAGVDDVIAPFVPPAIIWAIINPASPFATSESFDRTLESVGFVKPNSVERQHAITFTDPDHWISWSWSHGQRIFWELVPEDRLDEVRAEVRKRLEPLCEPDGSLTLIQTVRYTVAERAA
jgi:ubiquinone/menaquinone biosynthesis C-methylase UbiE